MHYEVEMKFPVAEMAGLESKLARLGATVAASQTEVDTYFAHPSRDFARTDEALRIRRGAICGLVPCRRPCPMPETRGRQDQFCTSLYSGKRLDEVPCL